MQAPSPTDVVLVHGYTGTSRIWERVTPFLPRELRAHPLSARGHAYGEPLREHTPATLDTLADGLEADMDARGLEHAHLVGNSMGGWLAFELARRGRALSVLALGPAGFWNGRDDPSQARRRRIFDAQERDARRLLPLLPIVYAVPALRRYALRHMAVHGERVSRAQLLEITRGMLACSVHPELFEATAGGNARYEALSCPVRIRLLEHDRLFPPADYDPPIRERVPGADVAVLPGVGHVPMMDDPALVAREIVASVSG